MARLLPIHGRSRARDHHSQPHVPERRRLPLPRSHDRDRHRPPPKGHGVSFADLDNDGDQDIYVSLGGAYSGYIARNALFQNPGSTNRWVTLRLVGTRANRAAIGARIQVHLQTPAGPRTPHRTVGSAGSFGNNPLRQEIGLGDASAISRVTILWPGDPTPQTVEGIQPGAFWSVHQGNPTPARLPLRSFQRGRR